jgi:hypothetical protein
LSKVDHLNRSISNNYRLYHSVNHEYRKIVRERCGININDSRKDLRICNKHKIEMETIDVSWKPINRKDNEIVQVKMYLPKRITRQENAPTSDEQREQYIRYNQHDFRSNMDDAVLQASLDAYRNSSSRSVRNTMNLIHQAIEFLKSSMSPEQIDFNKYENTPLLFDYEIRDKYRQDNVRRRTLYTINNCTDKHIKQHTGF